MRSDLTAEQQAWLGAHVARGEFPSVEAAARQLIDEIIAERAAEDDDLAWAKPKPTIGWRVTPKAVRPGLRLGAISGSPSSSRRSSLYCYAGNPAR